MQSFFVVGLIIKISVEGWEVNGKMETNKCELRRKKIKWVGRKYINTDRK